MVSPRDLERISKSSYRGLWTGKAHTSAAEDTGHLDELDGLLSGIHLEGMRRARGEVGENLGGLV